MTPAEALAVELATADEARRADLARELDALRRFAGTARANRRRLPPVLQSALNILPGTWRNSSPPPEPPPEAGSVPGLL